MAYIFFYSSFIILVVLFIICSTLRKPTLSNIVIGLTTVGYSLINDVLFGDQLELFHYINLEVSTIYMVLSAVMIYPILNILYTMFLPTKGKNILIYTFCWIVVMLFFEYASVITKTIIFTGWQPLPWSIVLYIVTYLWIYYFYTFLTKKYLPT